LLEEDLREGLEPLQKPYFTIAISLIDIIILVIEIVYNGGFEPFSYNLWLGPSVDTLIKFGAKDSYLMSYSGGFEIWRFITPMFLHIGVFHLMLNIFAQISLGIELEKELGPWKIAVVYFISGITGNILSAIFLVKSIEAGASTSLFGWLSIYIVDYIINWKYYRKPCKKNFSVGNVDDYFFVVRIITRNRQFCTYWGIFRRNICFYDNHTAHIYKTK